MRKVLLALTATFAVCLAVFAGTNMCVKKQNGDILRINVDDVYEVYFEDIFNPDTSSIIPPLIEPTVADTSAYAPLRFRITSDSTVELTDGNYRDLDSVNIPAKVKIDGKVYSVTKIGDYALFPKYSDCYGLISVAIPSSVTSIGEWAFRDCSSLTSIEIPSSVTSIGEGAFIDCSSLESINVDAKNPNYSSLDGIFYNKEKTEIIAVPNGIKGSISIPESVTSIDERAFSWCSSLTSIEIPSSVTSIGSSAFYYCSSLTSIEIPSSVTSIGETAFFRCSSLTSVEIPSSVTEIGESAFYSCSSLTSVEIPSSVTSIGKYAFEDCSSLTSIEIPSSVTSIGSEAFRYCSSMTSVEIPSSVTSIGSNAFRDCKNLDVVIDNSKENVKFYNYWEKETTIENSYAFEGVKSVKWLKEIDEDPSVADTSAYAPLKFWITSDSTVELTRGENWNSYRNLDSVNIPAKVKIEGKVYSVTSIGWDAFRVCSSLTSITIPESVTEIGSSAFFSCSSLTSITIPESVTEIGEYAFGYCSSVTSIEIPSSVTSIGRGAFSGYDKLDPEVLIYDYGTKCFGCIGDSSKCVEVVIPEGVISIDNSAFEGYYNLTSITIPESVTSIGSYAFSGCSSLESINVDVKNSIYSSLDGIIYNKEKTEIIYVPRGIKGSIHIPEGVTEIGEYAFYYCSSLESINVDAKNPNYSSLDGIVYNKEKTEIIAVPKGIKGSISIPSSVTSISYSAFYDCDSLTSIEIPSSVTSIGERAFTGCGSLTSIEIPSSVTSIGEYAFSGCSSLTSVAIPSSVTSIGSNAFRYCSSLTSVEIPSSVTEIGSDAFYGCDQLKPELLVYDNETKCYGWIGNRDSCVNVVIPEGVTEIGSDAFSDCRSLTSVEIPSSVTEIGSSTFEGCSRLTSVAIPASVTSIGSDAFYYCSSLTSITIPESVTKIGSDAFYNCWELDVVIDNSKENVKVESCAFLGVKSVNWLK